MSLKQLLKDDVKTAMREEHSKKRFNKNYKYYD